MKLSVIYTMNAIVCTIAAIFFREMGWINVAIQLWIVVVIFKVYKL